MIGWTNFPQDRSTQGYNCVSIDSSVNAKDNMCDESHLLLVAYRSRFGAARHRRARAGRWQESQMHIPDGYLSPSTCAALYAASAPFWYIALQRIKRLLNSRLIPLISVFAAFSFVIMMFNLPLPGGTTGHAVGMGLAAIVLGPWGAIISITIALILQAIFFGDGGILSIGANCFNMAIVGALVAYVVYRALAGRAPLTAPRRAIAGAVAGYIAI